MITLLESSVTYQPQSPMKRPKTPTSRSTSRRSRTKRVLDLDVLSTEEVRALIDACSRRAPTGIRNRALIALLVGLSLFVLRAQMGG